ncbi:MAG: F0F1 ATP synthase subunit B [Candidatus Atribacteria bacterium]|nr:F0F1 ATP synthase subunit B [Candidatus Atribacteria bacterium]
MIRIDRSIILQIINFVALVLLLFRFLFKPVVRALDQRSQFIRGELQKIEDEKKNLEATKRALEEEAARAKEKYLEIMDQAKLEASRIKEGIIREAYEEGEKIKNEYRRKARKEMEELLSGLREDIVELTEEVVKKFLATQITPEVQTRLIDVFLEEALRELKAQVEAIHER